jgi:AcrR family transcriptional regulator
VAPIIKAKDADAAPLRARKAQDRRELKKSGATRQRILDAAAHIFARKGFGRTLMGDIAAEVGIHVTALYYHFDTKDALAEAVINHVAEQGYRDVHDAMQTLPPDASFRQRVQAGVLAQLQGIIMRREYILAQLKVLSELPEEIQDRHRKMLRATASFWRELFHNAVRDGEIRRDFDPGVARMIMGGSMNWAVEWYREGGRSPRDIAAQITETMLDGMAPRGAAAEPAASERR